MRLILPIQSITNKFIESSKKSKNIVLFKNIIKKKFQYTELYLVDTKNKIKYVENIIIFRNNDYYDIDYELYQKEYEKENYKESMTVYENLSRQKISKSFIEKYFMEKLKYENKELREITKDIWNKINYSE